MEAANDFESSDTSDSSAPVVDVSFFFRPKHFSVDFMSFEFLITSSVVIGTTSFDTVLAFWKIKSIRSLVKKYCRKPCRTLRIMPTRQGLYHVVGTPVESLRSITPSRCFQRNASQTLAYASEWFPEALYVSEITFTPTEFLKLFDVHVAAIDLDNITITPSMKLAQFARIFVASTQFRIKVKDMTIGTEDFETLTQQKDFIPVSVIASFYNVDVNINPTAVYTFFEECFTRSASLKLHFVTAPQELTVFEAAWESVFNNGPQKKIQLTMAYKALTITHIQPDFGKAINY